MHPVSALMDFPAAPTDVLIARLVLLTSSMNFFSALIGLLTVGKQVPFHHIDYQHAPLL
jgi:hypothetical protein